MARYRLRCVVCSQLEDARRMLKTSAGAYCVRHLYGDKEITRPPRDRQRPGHQAAGR